MEVVRDPPASEVQVKIHQTQPSMPPPRPDPARPPPQMKQVFATVNSHLAQAYVFATEMTLQCDYLKAIQKNPMNEIKVRVNNQKVARGGGTCSVGANERMHGGVSPARYCPGMARSRSRQLPFGDGQHSCRSRVLVV